MRKHSEMASFLTTLIGSMMEDPAVRDRRCHSHLRAAKANADNLKNEWAQPVKHNGFWRSSASSNGHAVHAKFNRASQGAVDGPAVGASEYDTAIHAINQAAQA